MCTQNIDRLSNDTLRVLQIRVLVPKVKLHNILDLKQKFLSLNKGKYLLNFTSYFTC